MGIPTIKRERESYLLQTLESLLSGLNAEERQDVLIVVFVAEVCRYSICMLNMLKGTVCEVFSFSRNAFWVTSQHEIDNARMSNAQMLQINDTQQSKY